MKTTYNLRNEITVLSTAKAAFSFASKCVKSHLVVLGDNGKFWVVCFADAQKLTKAGYELAK